MTICPFNKQAFYYVHVHTVPFHQRRGFGGWFKITVLPHCTLSPCLEARGEGGGGLEEREEEEVERERGTRSTNSAKELQTDRVGRCFFVRLLGSACSLRISRSLSFCFRELRLTCMPVLGAQVTIWQKLYFFAHFRLETRCFTRVLIDDFLYQFCAC